MSTAAKVPETWELTGDQARKTLLDTGRWQLLKDSFVRLRAADGFSHSRSLAFVTSLVLVQGLIALVGFATAFDEVRMSREIVAAIQSAIPKPAGRLLTDAVDQARGVGAEDKFVPLLLGLIGTLVTGATAMGQIERGFNRIYGIERDRPTIEKYGRALVLAVGAGSCLAGAFLVFAFGRQSEVTEGFLRATWPYLRWPLALVIATLALTAMLRWSPYRRQPGWSWLGFGAALCVAGWVLVTVLLGAALSLSSSFGDTYGPLAGIVALQFWTLLSAIAIFFGTAVAAQLEAVRAGAPTPRESQAQEPAVRVHEPTFDDPARADGAGVAR
jgi:YihY family inner membrane protein